MITSDDVEILEHEAESLRSARGSDYSGVAALEKAIQYIKSSIQDESRLTVNVNSFIKVKLTDYGVSMYDKYIRNYCPGFLRKHGEMITPEIDKYGYSKFQLWEFMNIFGEYFYMANTNNVIYKNEIYIENDRFVEKYDKLYCTKCGAEFDTEILYTPKGNARIRYYPNCGNDNGGTLR